MFVVSVRPVLPEMLLNVDVSTRLLRSRVVFGTGGNNTCFLVPWDDGAWYENKNNLAKSSKDRCAVVRKQVVCRSSYQADVESWNETGNNLAKNTKSRCAVVR